MIVNMGVHDSSMTYKATNHIDYETREFTVYVLDGKGGCWFIVVSYAGMDIRGWPGFRRDLFRKSRNT